MTVYIIYCTIVIAPRDGFCHKKNKIVLLLASRNEMELHLVPASKQPQKLYDIQCLTPDDGMKDRTKYAERYSNKLNFIHRCIWLVLL